MDANLGQAAPDTSLCVGDYNQPKKRIPAIICNNEIDFCLYMVMSKETDDAASLLL